MNTIVSKNHEILNMLNQVTMWEISILLNTSKVPHMYYMCDICHTCFFYHSNLHL